MAAAIYSGPTTEQLTSDIDALSEEINIVRDDVGTYEPGSIISLQIDLRLKTLEATRQMLEQKRASLIRGIDLKFTQNGRELMPVDPATLKALDDEIAEAASAADAAQAKAEQYTSGLIKSLALVEEATQRASVALINERRVILMLGYGLPETPKKAVSVPTPASSPPQAASGPKIPGTLHAP